MFWSLGLQTFSKYLWDCLKVLKHYFKQTGEGPDRLGGEQFFLCLFVSLGPRMFVRRRIAADRASGPGSRPDSNLATATRLETLAFLGFPTGLKQLKTPRLLGNMLISFSKGTGSPSNSWATCFWPLGDRSLAAKSRKGPRNAVRSSWLPWGVLKVKRSDHRDHSKNLWVYICKWMCLFKCFFLFKGLWGRTMETTIQSLFVGQSTSDTIEKEMLKETGS